MTALQKLGQFSDTATELVNTTQEDLVHNLTNLEPTLKALADVGPYLDTVLAYLPTFPFSQNFIDRGGSRRLRQHLRHDGPDDPAAQAFTVPGHPVGRPERPPGARTRRSAHLNFNYEPAERRCESVSPAR